MASKSRRTERQSGVEDPLEAGDMRAPLTLLARGAGTVASSVATGGVRSTPGRQRHRTAQPPIGTRVNPGGICSLRLFRLVGLAGSTLNVVVRPVTGVVPAKMGIISTGSKVSGSR